MTIHFQFIVEKLLCMTFYFRLCQILHLAGCPCSIPIVHRDFSPLITLFLVLEKPQRVGKA
jgi:hypothetical protein